MNNHKLQMRKGSQSMYNPANKNVSKLGGGLAGSILIQGHQPNKSSFNQPRKVEGHDFTRTTKTNFDQTVSNLKNKPNQKVLEDQYINGLQQEIKYLQYELKLLKDKEMIEREGVNQLDNFLKDEIPINENILAMKNKYNATKSKLEDQLKNFGSKNLEAGDVLKTQRNQIQRLHQIIDAHRKEKNTRINEYKDKLGQLINEITLTNDESAMLSMENKKMQEESKRMNEEIAVIQRQNQKQKISEVRQTEDINKAKEKFEQNFRLARQNMIEATQKAEQLAELEDVNPFIKLMEDQNSVLRKKIMLNQKQKSTAENTVAEIQLFLNEQARQRQIQRQHKMKYLIVADQCRIQIQKIERDHDDTIKNETIRHKKILVKEMNNDLGEKEDIYNLLSDRLRNLEQFCSNLIQERKELQDNIEDQNKIQKQLKKELNTHDNGITTKRSTTEALKKVSQEIMNEIVPITDELEKGKGRIPIVQKQIEKKNTSIHYLNKQVDLLKELKSLDLQQLQMISQGGNQVQNILHSFIKNWEKIKSQ